MNSGIAGFTIGIVIGTGLGWALTPKLPPSPIAQFSPVTLPPPTGEEIKPTNPPPGWDRILEPNIIYPSPKWEDCKKYAIKYERKLIAIYNENNSYAPYSCILEKYNPKQ
jgi:hypothetical protein